MYREFDHISLGGTLYTPSISKNLLPIAKGEKFPFLRSVVFCLEDAIKPSQLSQALENIQDFLLEYKRENVKVFIRPRNSENLKEVLALRSIEKIDGFSLAKFSSENMEKYFGILDSLENRYHIMPVLESKDMFDNEALKKIRDFLLSQNKHNIVTLRFGGEDMFRFLGLKKRCEDSIHDFHISSRVFADLLSIFKPYGFNITAPVYNCLENKETFEKEVKRDIKEGFFGKTVIHPDQAKIINELYKVSEDEYEEAKAVLDTQKEGVFRYKNSMCEPAAHNAWAKNIINRYKNYNY